MQKEFEEPTPVAGWFSPSTAADMAELMRMVHGLANLTVSGAGLILDVVPPNGFHLTLEPSLVTASPLTSTVYQPDTFTPGTSQDNYALSLTYNIINPSASISITGILVPWATTGADIWIYNAATAYSITLTHDATSTATNRFFFPNLTDYVLLPRHWVRFSYYDSRWRLWSPNFYNPQLYVPSQITGNQNNYGTSNYWGMALDADAARDITGFDGGFPGRELLLYNRGSNTITIKHESGSSTAANRVYSATGADISLTQDDFLLLKYFGTVIGSTASGGDRWYTVGGSAMSGGTGTVTTFSAGDLAPLFTTSESNPTTTPALTFAQINKNANLVFAGPASGSAAAPDFRSLTQADMPTLGTVPKYNGLWKTDYAQPHGDSIGGTFTGFGLTTTSAAGTVSNVTNARGHYTGHASAASTNSDAGQSVTTGCIHLDETPFLTWIVEWPNSTDFGSGNNSRAWICVTDNITTLKAQDTMNNVSGLGFRISSGTSDTNFQIAFNDGGASAPAVTDSGVTVAEDTRYVLQIDATDNTSIKFYINGTLVHTISGADLPATTTRMSMLANTRTLTNATKNFYVGLYRQDYVN